MGTGGGGLILGVGAGWMCGLWVEAGGFYCAIHEGQ